MPIVEPLVSLAVLRAAFRTMVRRRGACWQMARGLLSAPGPVRHKLKNAAVLPKAFAVASWLQAHRVDHVHAYWLSSPATVAYVAARIAGIPWSASAHRWDIYDGNLRDRKLADASFVRTISERGRRDLSVSNRETAICIPLGIPLKPYRAPRVLTGNALRILCPANLVPVKGHSTLLLALKLLNERGVIVRCTLAGSGSLRPKLEQLARAYGIERIVHFAGVVPQDRLHAQMQGGEYDVVVLPSDDRGPKEMEGIPAALIEAMAIGVPVVATTSGSIPELVEPDCGTLVAPGDARALAAALEGLLQHPARARQYRENAARVARERHNANRQAQRLMALFTNNPLSEREKLA